TTGEWTEGLRYAEYRLCARDEWAMYKRGFCAHHTEPSPTPGLPTEERAEATDGPPPPAWVLWYNDPETGIRIARFSTRERCESTASRLNKEHAQTRPHGYVGVPAFCYWREPSKLDLDA